MKSKEGVVERKLKTEIEKLGGLCYKFVSPGRRNVPDRLCILPGSIIFFVEVKAPGQQPTNGQFREGTRINDLGIRVFWVCTTGEVLDLIEHIKMFGTQVSPKM